MGNDPIRRAFVSLRSTNETRQDDLVSRGVYVDLDLHRIVTGR